MASHTLTRRRVGWAPIRPGPVAGIDRGHHSSRATARPAEKPRPGDDTSALVAVLRGEDDADDHLEALASAAVNRISAATLVETTAVVDGPRDPVISRRLDELLALYDVTVEPITAAQAALARAAYRGYGRGSGHPAKLNLGDCFSYALARVTGEPLLFTGDDFTATDLRPALPG